MSRAELMSTLREDKYVVRLREVCDNIGSKLPIERLLKEAESLHTDRPSRALFKHAMAPTKLYEARLKDLSNRARLSEIHVGLIKQRAILKTAASEVKKHLLARYGDDLKAVGSNSELRRAFVDKALNFSVTLQEDIEAAIEVIATYVKDLDQAAFGLRDATELVKIMTERRDQVV